jgi:hypothetical protein
VFHQFGVVDVLVRTFVTLILECGFNRAGPFILGLHVQFFEPLYSNNRTFYDDFVFHLLFEALANWRNLYPSQRRTNFFENLVIVEEVTVSQLFARKSS